MRTKQSPAEEIRELRQYLEGEFLPMIADKSGTNNRHYNMQYKLLKHLEKEHTCTAQFFYADNEKLKRKMEKQESELEKQGCEIKRLQHRVAELEFLLGYLKQ